jgi:hypothetical protein
MILKNRMRTIEDHDHVKQMFKAPPFLFLPAVYGSGGIEGGELHPVSSFPGGIQCRLFNSSYIPSATQGREDRKAL